MILDTSKVINLIRTYQKLGFIKADIDPLNFPAEYKSEAMVQIENDKGRLNYKTHGFTEQDLDKEFTIHTENLEVRLL